MGESELDESMMDLPESVLREAASVRPDDPRFALSTPDFWRRFWARRSFGFEKPEAVRAAYIKKVAQYEAALGRDNPLAKKLVDLLGEDGADEILAPAQERKSKRELAEEEEEKRKRETSLVAVTAELHDHKEDISAEAVAEAFFRADTLAQDKKDKAEKAEKAAQKKREADEAKKKKIRELTEAYEAAKRLLAERWRREEATLPKDDSSNAWIARVSRAMDILHKYILSPSTETPAVYIIAGLSILLEAGAFGGYRRMTRVLEPMTSDKFFRDRVDFAKAFLVPTNLRVGAKVPLVGENETQARKIYRALLNACHPDRTEDLRNFDPALGSTLNFLTKQFNNANTILGLR